ncbi:SDR family NAD(P)-dependent oxidoreductase [Aliiglaciecola sp. CAU 1673]|uniref:SDR family NAD(P)-dependent oxidoreductase n=1 Tax=Aliiglaciecola sp. CAU 1673 TaxID=3032595 RepID=UPI0023DAA891|nr:SDR family NAD(P)-dependent oxidoreductase [Aliiglaciecola sp. CAU 1673]MDF2177779.1 SDR family NAD(P)-dependent oxidoreductase [Aliiglaciecola sp. CAU 1673]
MPTKMNNVLIIGASSAIAQAITKQLCQTDNCSIDLVSRRLIVHLPGQVRSWQLQQQDDQAIGALCQQLAKEGRRYDLVLCCSGILHGEQLKPERRLEDIQSSSLQQYFHVNSVLPALWLKHLLPLVKGNTAATCVFFSARVGSINDNRLGGWYGYRASKAALNMLIKTAQVEYARRAPNVRLVSYHPGTVDTPLSKPFQSNVPADKLFSSEQAAGYLLSVLGALPDKGAPFYLDWQGQTIPW